MLPYIVKRIIAGFVTLFVLVTITFFLVRLMPGNPFQSENISQQTMDMLMSAYDLDKPAVVQFKSYLCNLLRGDFGFSYKKTSVPVNVIMKNALPATFSLGLIAFFISSVAGVFLGVWHAASRSNLVKGVLLAAITLGISMPNFIIAILLMMVFGIYLNWFDVVGLYSASNYVLPVLSLSLYPMAMIARLTRTTFFESMSQDYVTLARAKGLKDRVIAVKHILKNTMTPVITYMGQSVAFLLTGSFVVENIYTIPGLGMEFVRSIQNRDYTVIMGLTIFMGTIVITANLISDIVCAMIDPRIRARRGNE